MKGDGVRRLVLAAGVHGWADSVHGKGFETGAVHGWADSVHRKGQSVAVVLKKAGSEEMHHKRPEKGGFSWPGVGWIDVSTPVGRST